MIVSSFITLIACLIDGIEFVSQARPVCNQETQWTNAITCIQISSQANTDCEKASLFAVPILPPLSKFRGDRWGIGVAPFKFQGDVRCTPLMVERSCRI